MPNDFKKILSNFHWLAKTQSWYAIFLAIIALNSRKTVYKRNIQISVQKSNVTQTRAKVSRKKSQLLGTQV